MKINYKKILANLIPILIGLFFIYFSYINTTINERNEIYRNLKNADYIYVILSVFIGFISHIIRAFRWKLMLNPLGYSPKTHNSILAVFIGYLSNYALPRLGDVIRATVLAKYESIPFNKSFGTIVIERAIDLFLLSLLILVAMILNFELIHSHLHIEKWNPLLFFIILFFSLILGYKLFSYLKTSKKNSIIKLLKFLEGFKEGFLIIFKMDKKITYLIQTLLIWSMYLGMFILIKWSIPETTSLSIEPLILAFVIGSLSFFASNGGIGIYPYVISLVLINYGVSKESSLAFGWIMWTSQSLMLLILGSLSFFILPLINKNN